MARVCDIMHKGVIHCRPGDKAREVVRLMKTHSIRSLAVVDEMNDVCGLISTMEIISLYGQDLENYTAEQIMRPFKFEVDALWPVEKAITLMKKKKIEHLLIIDPHVGSRQPVGIISSIDIVRYMSGIKSGSLQQFLKIPPSPPGPSEPEQNGPKC